LAAFQEKYYLLIRKIEALELAFYWSASRRQYLEMEGDTSFAICYREFRVSSGS